MRYHDGMKFSTFDADNDNKRFDNCAKSNNGGWWFNDCYTAQLNGQYLRTSYSSNEYGIHWNIFHPSNYSLKASTMMIKRN